MARLDVLLPRVFDDMPSAPKALALRALSDSLKEFCARTHIWQETVDPVRVRARQPLCEVTAPQGTIPVSILSVRLGASRLTPLFTQNPQRAYHSRLAGPPEAYTQVSPTEILLSREPTEDAVLDVVAALTLASGDTTAEVPDSIINDYGETIAMGAKMRMARQSTQPWAMIEMAGTFAALYYNEVNLAKTRVNSALGAAQLRVQPPIW